MQHRSIRYLMLLGAFIIFPASSIAFDISVSPNESGNLDFDFSHSWHYAGGPFFSRLTALSSTFSDGSSVSGKKYLSSARDIKVGATLLGYELQRGAFGCSLAAEGVLDRSAITEMGYVDGYGSSAGYRFFISNDRVIYTILPRIAANASGRLGPIRLEAGAEYSPWLYVLLDQVVSTSATPSLATLPEDLAFESGQSARNAFSLSVTASLAVGSLRPAIEATYDDLAIGYTYLNILGTPVTEDAHTRRLDFGCSLSLPFASFGGVSPKVSVVREVMWYEANGALAEPRGTWKIYLGAGEL